MVAIFKIVSQKYQLIRFDQRGNGLSDWEVENISEDSMIADMQAIVDSTKISDFSIFGMSQGCAFAIRYAIEHTDQVRCLILFGGYIFGRLKWNSDEGKNRHDIGMKIIESGWGSNTPIYRNFFTSAFLPDASKQESGSFDELQRVCTDTTNAMRIQEMNSNVDVTEYARRINIPTLVLHCKVDQVNPLKEGRRMASVIPNAYFKTLTSNNHVLLEGKHEFSECFHEVDKFIKEI